MESKKPEEIDEEKVNELNLPEFLAAKKATKYTRAKHWGPCTWNSTEGKLPTKEEMLELILSLDVHAYSAQLETGESGTPHIQFYFELQKKKVFNEIKLKFPKAYLCISKWSQKAYTYCCKLEGRVPESEGGWTIKSEVIPTFSGERSDITSALDTLEKSGMAGVVDLHAECYVKMYKGLEQFNMRKRARNVGTFNTNMKVTVIWGSTGAGKTRHVFEKGDVYEYNADGGFWFDGYMDQKRLLIDEFKDQISLTLFLKLIDGYRRQWPVKGSFAISNWDEIYITSNIDPEKWYPLADVTQREALKRRIHRVVHIDTEPNWYLQDGKSSEAAHEAIACDTPSRHEDRHEVQDISCGLPPTQDEAGQEKSLLEHFQ